MSSYLFISKFEQRGHGVWAGGEDEDEGGAAVAIDEGFAQVKGRRFDERTTQTAGNKLLYHGNHLEDELMKCLVHERKKSLFIRTFLFIEHLKSLGKKAPCELTLSGLRQRITSILWNWLSFSCHSSGKGVWWGLCKHSTTLTEIISYRNRNHFRLHTGELQIHFLMWLTYMNFAKEKKS